MSHLHVVIAPNQEIALRRLLGGPTTVATDSALLLPSTLDAGDAAVQTVGKLLAEQGVSSSILAPATATRRLSSIVRPLAFDPGWRVVSIERPDVALKKVVLPTDLVEAGRIILICDLDRVALHGPFVLDVLGRYLHPRDRVRVLATSQRQQSLAEVNLAVSGPTVMICMSVEGGVLVARTRDLILGELVALALAELQIVQDVGFTGPWEDPVVQRATELELGVRLPGEIGMLWEVDERMDDTVYALEDHVSMRLGLPERR